MQSPVAFTDVNPQTTPTLTQVNAFIQQISDEMDISLNDCGYVVPVVVAAAPYTAAKTLSLLKTICAYGVASMATQSTDTGAESSGAKSTSRSSEWQALFESKLNDIISGATKLFDATPTSLVADFPYQELQSGNLEAPPTWTGGATDDGTSKQPYFSRAQQF